MTRGTRAQPVLTSLRSSLRAMHQPLQRVQIDQFAQQLLGDLLLLLLLLAVQSGLDGRCLCWHQSEQVSSP